jgi:hypothetical protein
MMHARRTVLRAEDAKPLLVCGSAPHGLEVRGKLELDGETAGRLPAGLKAHHLKIAAGQRPVELPDDLDVDLLDISGCSRVRSLPRGLRVRVLLANNSGLTKLPTALRCFELHAANTAITSLPDGFVAENRLVLSGCNSLTKLPNDLKVGSLNLSGCTVLASLPEGLDVWFLDLQGCTTLTDWPRRAAIHTGRLNLRGCTGITHLPEYITRLATLDIGGCTSLTELPEGLEITGWLDVANSGLLYLPDSLACVSLRWRGVPVDGRIVFDPSSITVSEVLAESNAERRRVLLERVGYEKFFTEANPAIVDGDIDPGGPRRLLRMPMEGDEDLVCLEVNCPSTARKYLIRVPPTLSSCRDAAAWIAGFDDANDYQPLIET